MYEIVSTRAYPDIQKRDKKKLFQECLKLYAINNFDRKHGFLTKNFKYFIEYT